MQMQASPTSKPIAPTISTRTGIREEVNLKRFTMLSIDSPGLVVVQSVLG